MLVTVFVEHSDEEVRVQQPSMALSTCRSMSVPCRCHVDSACLLQYTLSSVEVSLKCSSTITSDSVLAAAANWSHAPPQSSQCCFRSVSTIPLFQFLVKHPSTYSFIIIFSIGLQHQFCRQSYNNAWWWWWQLTIIIIIIIISRLLKSWQTQP